MPLFSYEFKEKAIIFPNVSVNRLYFRRI